MIVSTILKYQIRYYIIYNWPRYRVSPQFVKWNNLEELRNNKLPLKCIAWPGLLSLLIPFGAEWRYLCSTLWLDYSSEEGWALEYVWQEEVVSNIYLGWFTERSTVYFDSSGQCWVILYSLLILYSRELLLYSIFYSETRYSTRILLKSIEKF